MCYPFSFLALTCIHSLIGPPAWIPSSGSSFLQAFGLFATWPRLCLKPLVLVAALSVVHAGPISLGPAFWIARHHDTAVLECSTCCIRQNGAAVLAQRNVVGTTQKSERLSLSNIILHPITAGGVASLGSLSSYVEALYPAWPGHAVDHLTGCQLESKMPK